MRKGLNCPDEDKIVTDFFNVDVVPRVEDPNLTKKTKDEKQRLEHVKY